MSMDNFIDLRIPREYLEVATFEEGAHPNGGYFIRVEFWMKNEYAGTEGFSNEPHTVRYEVRVGSELIPEAAVFVDGIPFMTGIPYNANNKEVKKFREAVEHIQDFLAEKRHEARRDERASALRLAEHLFTQRMSLEGDK